MRDDLNTQKSIVRLKEQLVSEIPYVPKSAEAKKYLLQHDIGVVLHIYHFWRQRLLPAVPRRYIAPSNVRNETFYVTHKARIDHLRQKIEAGENLAAYLSRQAHNRALDVDRFRDSGSFIGSRDYLLVCDGFYHLHLAPLPERTDELLVAQVTSDSFEVIGLFTHELFNGDGLNPTYEKYTQAVNAYAARKLPPGGAFLGGPGGGIQNAAGSSVISTLWQIHCRKILHEAEAYPGGLRSFTIKLYGDILKRETRYVDPRWQVADDGRLLIVDQKNKFEFWASTNGRWNGQPLP